MINRRGQMSGQSVRLRAIAILMLLATSILQVTADEHAAGLPDRTYLTHFTPGSDSPQITINAVERSHVNTGLFVDVAGVRLYVDSVDAKKRLRFHISNPATARNLVANQMDLTLRETGVEPDMIPVRGDEGRKLETQEMVLIKSGEFTRTGEFWDSTGGGLSEDQTPSRGARYQVRISAFQIDRFKVTNEDYCRFLNDGNAGYWTPWNLRIGRSAVGRNSGKFVPADRSLARHPVVLVNWYQAQGYAAWAGKRLPTEAEWEYAAGGTEGRKFPWGNEAPDQTRADFPVQFKHTVAVDMYPAGATPDGVFQMAGNSAEWVADYFDNASYRTAPANGVAVDPHGPAQGFFPATWFKYRVMFKGWCKCNRAEYLTCTKRHGRGPFEDAAAGVSFRCVKDALPKESE